MSEQTAKKKKSPLKNLALAVVGSFVCVCVALVIAISSPDAKNDATQEARNPTPDSTALVNSISDALGTTFAPEITSEPTLTSVIPSPTPELMGVTIWLEYESKRVGVKEIRFASSAGNYRAESGKTFISLYIIAENHSDSDWSFSPIGFSIVDGGGQVNGRLLIEPREPEFEPCQVIAGGMCEGWWTTEIFDRENVKENLVFRWSIGALYPTLETPIVQK